MASHVRDVWPDDRLPALIEAGEAVERMQASLGWASVQELVAREIAKIDRALDSGPKDSAQEYAYAHGRRSTLRMADEAARAIVTEAARRRKRAEDQQREAAESAPERQVA